MLFIATNCLIRLAGAVQNCNACQSLNTRAAMRAAHLSTSFLSGTITTNGSAPRPAHSSPSPPHLRVTAEPRTVPSAWGPAWARPSLPSGPKELLPSPAACPVTADLWTLKGAFDGCLYVVELSLSCTSPSLFLSLVFICICVYRSFYTSLRISPGSENYALTSSLMLGRSPHNRSSPSNLSCSSDTGSGSSAHWRQKSMPEGWGSTKHHLLLSYSLSLVSFKLLTAHPLIIQSFHRFICSSFHTALFMTRWLWHRPQNDASDWQHMRVYVSVIDLRTTGTLLSQRSGNWGQRMEAAASRHPAGPEWRTALTDRHQVRPHSISDELLKGRGINVRCLEVKRGKDQWRLLEKMNEQTKQLTEWKTERENGLRRMAVNIQKLTFWSAWWQK